MCGVRSPFHRKAKPAVAEGSSRDDRDRPDAPASRQATILSEVARQFSADHGHWVVVGDLVEGPAGVGVRVAEPDPCGSTDSRHVSLEFLLDPHDPDGARVGDCARGYADTDMAQIASAVALWSMITLPPLLELFDQTGRFADHYSPTNPRGLPGWHCIHGPWMAYGQRDSDITRLQQWALADPVLAILAPQLAPELVGPWPNGIRIFIGGSTAHPVAEVKINGTLAEAATDELGRLDWPRTEHFAACRAFVLAVHPG
jgi:Family of unknown function (DUF6348)